MMDSIVTSTLGLIVAVCVLYICGVIAQTIYHDHDDEEGDDQ